MGTIYFGLSLRMPSCLNVFIILINITLHPRYFVFWPTKKTEKNLKKRLMDEQAFNVSLNYYLIKVLFSRYSLLFCLLKVFIKIFYLKFLYKKKNYFPNTQSLEIMSLLLWFQHI